MPEQPPPPRQPWSGDEELEAPDNIGAAPAPEPEKQQDDRPGTKVVQHSFDSRSPFSAEFRGKQESAFGSQSFGRYKRRTIIGWSIVTLVVVVFVIAIVRSIHA